INGKISELQAAMGLAVFPYIDHIISERKNIVERYEDYFTSPKLQKMKIREHTTWNYSYYPLILESEEILLKIQQELNAKDFFPRRYFCPSLNTIDYIKGESMPISENISKRILCLPLYVGLDEK